MIIHTFHQRSSHPLHVTSHHITSLHYTTLPIFHVSVVLDVSSPRFQNHSLLLTFTFPLREWFRNVRILSPNNAALLPRDWNPQLRYCESAKTHFIICYCWMCDFGCTVRAFTDLVTDIFSRVLVNSQKNGKL